MNDIMADVLIVVMICILVYESIPIYTMITTQKISNHAQSTLSYYRLTVISMIFLLYGSLTRDPTMALVHWISFCIGASGALIHCYLTTCSIKRQLKSSNKDTESNSDCNQTTKSENEQTENEIANDAAAERESQIDSTTIQHQSLQYCMITFVIFLLICCIFGMMKKFDTLKPESRAGFVGVCGGIVTDIWMASPLISHFKQVWQEKSTNSMPFIPSMIIFIYAMTWTGYAMYTHDQYLYFPHLVGCFFGAIQLLLFLWFPPATVWFWQPNIELKEITHETKKNNVRESQDSDFEFEFDEQDPDAAEFDTQIDTATHAQV